MKENNSERIINEYFSLKDKMLMKRAIALAKRNLKVGIFPVGCVIGVENVVLAEGVRKVPTIKRGKVTNEIDHAEIRALKNLFNINLKNLKLSSITIYSTLEPCLMCFAAILFSGIGRLVFAYEDIMGGGTNCISYNLRNLYRNSIINIVPNVLRKESLSLFKIFFSQYNNIYWQESELSRYTLKQKKY